MVASAWRQLACLEGTGRAPKLAPWQIQKIDCARYQTTNDAGYRIPGARDPAD